MAEQGFKQLLRDLRERGIRHEHDEQLLKRIRSELEAVQKDFDKRLDEAKATFSEFYLCSAEDIALFLCHGKSNPKRVEKITGNIYDSIEAVVDDGHDPPSIRSVKSKTGLYEMKLMKSVECNHPADQWLHNCQVEVESTVSMLPSKRWMQPTRVERSVDAKVDFD